MQPACSVEIADSCITLLLDQFQLNLRSKELGIIAQSVVSKQFTKLSEQFVKLVAPNTFKTKIIQQYEPKNINVDNFSKLNVQRSRKSASLDTITTNERPSRNRSVIKQIASSPRENARRKKELVKLEQSVVVQKPKQSEERMRRRYLQRLQTEKSHKELELKMSIEREKMKERQKGFLKHKTYFTYDYTGKVIQGKGKGATCSLAISLKSGICKKMSIAKKAQKKKTETENINLSMLESAYKRNRKLSTISRQSKYFTEPVYNQNPIFESPQKLKTDTLDVSQMKLSEFQGLCRRKRAHQYKFFTAETKTSLHLPAIHTLKSIPTSTDFQKKTRFSTENIIGESSYNRRSKKSTSIDIITMNRDLYESIMIQD